MKRFILLTSVMVTLLVLVSVLEQNERRTVETGDLKGDAIKVNSPLPYRDDADYSEQGNDIFPLGEGQTIILPGNRAVP